MRLRIAFARVIGRNLLLIVILLCSTHCSRPDNVPTIWPQKEIGVSEKAANDLVAQLSQVPHDVEVLSVVLTDEGLTSYVRVYLADANLHEPTILVTRQGLYASAGVGRQTQRQVRVLFTVDVDSGALRVRVLRATVDDHAMPRPALRCMEQITNAVLADTASPVQVERVILREGALTIEGAPRTIHAN